MDTKPTINEIPGFAAGSLSSGKLGGRSSGFFFNTKRIIATEKAMRLEMHTKCMVCRQSRLNNFSKGEPFETHLYLGAYNDFKT